MKKGLLRLDRRPASGITGAPKKHGHGGKFTWEGPAEEDADFVEPPPAALDERDPNHVEEEEEKEEEEEGPDAQETVRVVEVAKVAGPQGVARLEVNL